MLLGWYPEKLLLLKFISCDQFPVVPDKTFLLICDQLYEKMEYEVCAKGALKLKSDCEVKK